jgi:hypothetical protein
MQRGSHNDEEDSLMLAIQYQTFTETHPTHQRLPVPTSTGTADRAYHLVAVDVTDNGTPHRPILALRRYLPIIDYLKKRLEAAHQVVYNASQWDVDARALTRATGMSEAMVRSMLALHVRQPHPLLRPLVIRATLGERILVSVTNRLAGERLNVALVDDHYGIHVRDNAMPLQDGETSAVLWHCRHAGVYPIYNQAATGRAKQSSLLGVLIVEP